MGQVTERDWLYVLALIPGLGRVRLRAIYEATGSFGTTVDNWDHVADQLKLTAPLRKAVKRQTRIESVYQLLQERTSKGVDYMCCFDDDYPVLLRHIPDPPLTLFYRGDIHLLQQPAVGVVGSRRPTPYGKASCAYLVKELVQAGLVIISGLAHGIDGEAHQTALAAGGKTVGVLGCGIDQIYPASHRLLYQKIASLGLLISEHPPGTPPVPGLFPERNRIISGLSLGVLVVEAAEKSGSLITADCALEQGREVFAIPGPIFSSVSAGPHNLIKQGAKLVTRSSDVLDELGVSLARKSNDNQTTTASASALEPDEKAIVSVISHEGTHADDLVGLLEPDMRRNLHQVLIRLEAKGAIVALPGGYFAKR
ncbi:DNA-processing protein DprA [Brevibacillus sp. NRS-1366]|uniref:DNA-processing protein DprA n=1 Tax=Brevibacillus sp. NRS-1366 TaxID=3233899 RepID=UPI003D25C396